MTNKRLPTLTYCGLTIVMSNPSRFDIKSNVLLSANGGCYLNEVCLNPDFNIYQCEVRLKECKDPLLPNTKCVLLLGELAAQEWLNNTENKIGEIRGSVYVINDIPHIASFSAQDCVDIKDYEATKNEVLQEMVKERMIEHDAGIDEKRRHGVTARSNFGFWLQQDVKKCKIIIKNEGKIPTGEHKPNYKIYPSADELINVLRNTKNELLFLDLETDGPHNIQCMGFSFGLDKPTYCFPFILHDYSLGYSHQLFCKIIHALIIALQDNIAVAFNGAAFDFMVFARKYCIPIVKAKDVMLMQHRCYQRVEKSLGHAMSLWTWEPFHKDEGDTGYHSIEQVNKKMQYCAKDVYGMMLVYEAMMKHADRNPGLHESFNQVNDAIIPYMCMTLQGIRFDEEMRKNIMKTNDELMMQYLRFIKLLIGKDASMKLQRRYKSALPSSPPQCVEYFHNMLGYPVVARGKEKKDGTRNAKLSKDAIFKLKLQFDNPVLDFVIAYREIAKESGSLKFNPWVE